MMQRSIFFLILSLIFANTAAAADLNAAKANGQVCEQTDGYLRANVGAVDDVQEMVGIINAKRRAEYEKIANKNNVTLDQVARLTAEKVINKAPQYRCQ